MRPLRIAYRSNKACVTKLSGMAMTHRRQRGQDAATTTAAISAPATDARGRVQPAERDPQIITPYANNWIDRRSVEIK